MISWYYMVATACLLLCFLLYKEWRRKKRSWLYGRLTASLMAVAGLLLMAYPFAEDNSETAIKKLALLTDGFAKDSINNFLHQANAAIPFFSGSPSHLYKPAGNPVQLVTDWGLFSTKHTADTFHVFGNGFDAETLAALDPHPIVFHASPALPAISAIYWKQHTETGEPLLVQGSYKNTTQQKIKIVLQAFGTDKDSVFIDAAASRDFALHTIPLHNGRAVFSLIVMDGKDTLQNEPIPVDVQPAAPLQLLILSSSPDFDNTYLKNQLSQQGYQVSVITTISSNKADKQFLNVPAPQNNGRLSVAYLSKFDVLITDEETLQKINTTELAAIRSVIQEKGTGLLIKMDAEKHTASFYSGFFPVKALQQDRQVFLLPGSAVADSIRYKIKITDPVCIKYQPGTQIILQDAQSNIFAAGIIYGGGKIIATTLQNTYSMALAGDKASYLQLWYLLLNKAARKIYPEETWLINPFIRYVNYPVQFQAEKNDVLVPQAVAGKTSIYLKQDALLPFRWNGVYWPSASGWQTLPQLNTQAGEWYVYKTGDWQQLTNQQHLEETKKYAAMHPVSFKEAPGHATEPFSVNRVLFMLIIFLICCVFLWVEQKTT